MTEKNLSPFTNIPQAPDQSSRERNTYLNEVQEFQVGTGTRVMRVDRRGLWLGGSDPSSAGFAVDMDGNISGSSLTLSSISGDLDDISDGSTYKRAVQNQLTGGDRAYSGLNSSSEIIKGFLDSQLSSKSLPYTGVRVDSNGIYGRNSGSTTFYIDSGGDAYFSGDITASTMTSSTITGGTIQTATTGFRLIMDGSNNAYEFRSGSTLLSQMVSTSVPYSGLAGARFEHGTGTIGIEVSGQGVGLGSRSIVLANSSGTSYFGMLDDDSGNYYLVNNLEIASSWIPYSDNTYNLGSSSKTWDNGYIRGIFSNSVFADNINSNNSSQITLNDVVRFHILLSPPGGSEGEMFVYLDQSNVYHLYVYLNGVWREVQTV